MTTAAFVGWMVVTAYACPPHCGLTASGVLVGPGSIAAPASIPFGTQLCIDGWGCGTVTDRGGDITEGRLDVWMPSHAAALQWGWRTVAVSRLTQSAPRISAAWSVHVESVRYLDGGQWVTRTRWDTERGPVDTYDIEGEEGAE